MDEDHDEFPDRVGLDSLPAELHAKILRLLDVPDLLNYARVCRRFRKYSDAGLLWKSHWIKMSAKTPFCFLEPDTLAEFGVNFRDLCRRLWKVTVSSGGEDLGVLIPKKCAHCREFTCLDSCPEDSGPSNKAALDIGGKLTWLVTTNYTLKRHLSMIAVPKSLKCLDCDTTLSRDEYLCDCIPRPQDLNPSVNGMPGRSSYCQSRRVASHTALEYCSRPLPSDKDPDQPFCLFCEDDKVHRMHCEREMVTSTKLKMKGVRNSANFHPFSSSSVNNEEDYLTNGYCKDTASMLGAHNLDLVSPLLALEHEEAFSVVKAFIKHLLKHYDMIDDLRKPNSSITLTEPARLPLSVKESLLKFFFEEIKVARLCLLPKALAVAKLFDVGTCIVVDSGATSTSVWVVIDGKVEESRTQTVSVGGWNVSQFLKQALTWQDNQDAAGATISSLDTSVVKEKCRLSLNLAREEANHRNVNRSETLHIKSQTGGHRKLEMTEITLSSELYLAPEMMYASLDLPSMVDEATKDLPRHLIKDCFSHILITGGNTDLQGFAQRFSSDLRELLPEHSPVINVHPSPNGNHSWNTVMGANTVMAPSAYENLPQLHEPGYPLWMTREEYITFGGQQLAACDTGIREG